MILRKIEDGSMDKARSMQSLAREKKSLEKELSRIESAITSLQGQRDKILTRLNSLDEQVKKNKAYGSITDAFMNSSKTIDEIMEFLKP